MEEILLKTEKLSKSFSNGGAMQHVLRNIDLELYKGDFTVIMGASGAGKSTLLYALSGMDTPTLGTITFGGRVISDLSQTGWRCSGGSIAALCSSKFILSTA